MGVKTKMAYKNPFKGLTIGKVIVTLVGLIIIIQVLSLAVSLIFPSVPALKTGFFLILITGGVSLIFLLKVVFRGQSFTTNDYIGFALLLGITIAMFAYGDKFLPQVFSFLDSSAVQSAISLRSVLNLP